MKIIYKTGDMFKGPERALVHGCNAQGVMGSGVARIVIDHYTYAFNAYRAHYEKYGLKVGEIIVAEDTHKIIINAISQEFFGRDPNTVYVSYDGVRSALKEINRYAFNASISEIAFPLIGAGLANGKWSIISKIIEDESVDFQPVVYLIDGKIPRE